MAVPTVISTWPVREKDRFAHILGDNGISVLPLPLIRIHYLSFSLKRGVEEYNWIVFTSKNGVQSFFKHYNFDPQNKIAVIGKGTAEPLKEQNIIPAYTGDGHSGKDFAIGLKREAGSNNKILLALGNLAPNVLYDALSSDNSVERVNVYETRIPESLDRNLLTRIVRDNYDLIAVSSPSGIRHLHQLVTGTLSSPLRIVSIGETTTAAALELGIKPLATAQEQSYKGLAKCVVDVWGKGR